MPLTDIQIRKVDPRDKQYKLSDGGGFYLPVRPSGTRTWHLKLRINGKEQRLTFGTYSLIEVVHPVLSILGGLTASDKLPLV